MSALQQLKKLYADAPSGWNDIYQRGVNEGLSKADDIAEQALDKISALQHPEEP